MRATGPSWGFGDKGESVQRGRIRRGMGRRGGQPSGTAGLGLSEAIVSFALMLVVLMGFLRVLISTSKANEASHEATQAKLAARRMMEVLAAESFETVYSRYNDDASDDPAEGESPGSGFVVEGLEAPEGDWDGLAGEIVFPVVGGALREDVELPRLGMPMDLNADGNIDGLDHGADHVLLPVQVRVRWAGASGPGLVEFTTLMADD